MTTKERVKGLVKALAYINGFEDKMKEMGFIWDTSSSCCPMKACDCLADEIGELLGIDSSSGKSDKLGNSIFYILMDDNFEENFESIWEEFGTDES